MFTLFLATLFCVAIFVIRNRRVWMLSYLLTGPMYIPFFGNGLLLLGDTQALFSRFKQLADKFPSPFRIWFSGLKMYVVIYEPEDIEIVATKALEKDDMYNVTKPWTGNGLFAAPVEQWRVHRKQIQPTFHPKILNSFMEIFHTESEILCELLTNEVDRPAFDVFHYISPATLDIICQTAMGYELSAQSGKGADYIRYSMNQCRIESLRMFKIWLQNDRIFNLTSLAKEQEENVKYLHGITDRVIQNKIQGQSSLEGSSSKRAFLDHFIEVGFGDDPQLSRQRLREEVDTIMIAGNDTTASVASFVLMMLGMHQDIQDKVHVELDRIFGRSNRPCDLEDLRELRYLEMVINETMRIFPIAVMLVRKCSQDMKLGTCVIPAGTGCIIAIYKTHMLPKYWPHPTKFDPDRFSQDLVRTRPRYAFLPFGAGPRNCIGMRYAYMSLKVMLSTVLRKFHITAEKVPLPEIPVKVDLFLKPINGFPIRIQKREFR